MSQVQFTGTNVLFFADQVSFCSAYCTCTDPPTPPPPPVETRTCETCASPLRCAYCPTCTATTLQVTFNAVTMKTACVLCDSGNSIKITAGALTGPFKLKQDPQNPCRWSYDQPDALLVASGFAAGTCSGSPTDSTRLRITLERDATGATIRAALVVPNAGSESEFVLFAARADFEGDLPDSLVLTQSSPDDTYCTDWQTAEGGKLGFGGTATVIPCPAVVIPCTCTDSTLPLYILNLTLPTECSLCIPTATPADWDGQLTHLGSCHWSVSAVTVGGCDNVTAEITFDAAGPCGCGYYLTVTNGTDAMGVWWRESDNPKGQFHLCDGICDGLPTTIDVDDIPPPTVAPLLCPAGVQPSALVVSGFDQIVYQACATNPDGIPWSGLLLQDSLLPCHFAITSGGTEPNYTFPGDFMLNTVVVDLQTDADGLGFWSLEVWQECAYPTPPQRMWVGRKYNGHTPQGEYQSTGEGLSSTPFTLTIS